MARARATGSASEFASANGGAGEDAGAPADEVPSPAADSDAADTSAERTAAGSAAADEISSASDMARGVLCVHVET